MKQGEKTPKNNPAEIESKSPHSASPSGDLTVKQKFGKDELGKYIPSRIEEKWQKRWEEDGIYRFRLQKDKENYYTLVELPYPSGDLHLGHWFAFVPPDAHARYSRMSGKNTFFPNGFDAFGLPAENAAIKRGIHPQDWTLKNIETMKKQFGSMGTMIDWSHEAITCLPEYYTWNQWIFLKMYEKGLAYRGKTMSNWCPSCQTVLANEAIEDGKCWRCGTVVEQKEIEQWFLRITEYADQLLWPEEKTKKRSGVDFDNCIVIHGCPQSEAELLPKENRWMNWLEKTLRNRGANAVALEMPRPWDPKYSEWKHTLEKQRITKDTIVIGHSCGAAFLVRWLLETKKKVKKLILVAPAKIPDPKGDKRIELYDFELPNKTREIADETVIFISNDDERHLNSAKMYQKALGARVVNLKDKQHFVYWQTGIYEFPELLEEVIASEGEKGKQNFGPGDVDWPQSVREGQNNWIGKSEGAVIDFELLSSQKPNFVMIHGYTGSPSQDFQPWLKNELEKRGFRVQAPELPNTDNPSEKEQVSYVLEHCRFDEHTILLGHSLGAAVALKVLEKLDHPISALVLAAGFVEPRFKDHDRPFKDTFTWNFDYEKIKNNVSQVKILHAANDSAVPKDQAGILVSKLGGQLIEFEANGDHITHTEEPEVLKALLPTIEVFTTRPDTLYGVTFLVVAPEHELVGKLLAESRIKNQEFSNVKKYVELAKKKTERERKMGSSSAEASADSGKTGVFTGFYAIHPITHEEIPIWVADYVLWGYGTGAIMAVPGHDERDFEFAKKFDLQIIRVVSGMEKDQELPYFGSGKLINSGDWDGWQVPQGIAKVIASLESARIGRKKTTYHLHDWSVSRQRYWGTPVPIVYCANCWKITNQQSKIKSEYGKDYTEIKGIEHAIIPVSEKDLPVTLPYEVDYTPKGKPPLASAEEWMEVLCPSCGGKATRDPETLDTFFDSSWYYYRYLDPRYTKLPFDSDLARKLMPVDIYFGGAEHTLGHTLYARFFTKFFHDLGLIEFSEFAKKRVQHGVILGPDGQRMSKSRGNVVNPDDVVKEYGTDTVRVYLCFMMPYIDTVAPWNPNAIAGIYRFLRRIWDLYEKVNSSHKAVLSKQNLHEMHKTIKKVGDDLANIKFNTAIASMMEWLNFLSARESVSLEEYKNLLLLLAPFAPHMTEEMWQFVESRIKNQPRFNRGQESSKEDRDSKFMIHDSIHLQSWPEYDEKYLVADTLTIAVQVNGKLRGSFEIESERVDDQAMAEAKAREIENIANNLTGKTILKVVYIKGKILNFVAK